MENGITTLLSVSVPEVGKILEEAAYAVGNAFINLWASAMISVGSIIVDLFDN